LHNQCYWNGAHYLGIGAGAHSFDAGPRGASRWSNLRHPRAYLQAIAAGETAVAETRLLGLAETRSDFVFTGLRRVAGVDGARFAERFGVPLAEAFPQVPALVRDGLLEWADDHLRLSLQGLRFADTVAASFV
jgi:oxygen-independent coproporphyrinogen-3 oxidase